MKKQIPTWLPSLLWVVGIFFTAFFIGKAIDIYIEDKMTVPSDIILAKEEVKKETPTKSLNDYQRDIIPMFKDGKNIETPSPASEKAKPGEEKKPESPVNLVEWDQELKAGGSRVDLKGTIIGSDTAVAFVEVGGEDMALHIGEKAGSYYIDRITKSTVVFRKGTEEVAVVMGLGEKRNVSTRRTARTVISKPKTDKGPDLDKIVSNVGGKTVVDRKLFNALLKPPSRLANSIKFIPYSKDGKPYGIKVSYLKGGSFFTRVGLQAGDILVKANAKDINSVEDSFQVYQMFKNEDHLTLEVDRGGSPTKVPIEFR